VGVEFKNKEVRQRIAFLVLHAQYGHANRFQANCEGSIHGFAKLQSVTLRGETSLEGYFCKQLQNYHIKPLFPISMLLSVKFSVSALYYKTVL
jgi:hypothetical protein